MKVLAVDDEYLALRLLVKAIADVDADAEVFPFTDVEKAIEWAKNYSFDVAFLDIKMRGITGIELAKVLKDIRNDINIIFVTGYDDYTSDAMDMHASGYILKPVTAQKVKRELSDLRYPIKEKSDMLIKIKCFGNFEAYDENGNILEFTRKKSKELLAYLIYKNGASCSIKELASYLFENEEYTAKERNYVQQIITSLNKTLNNINAQDVIIKKFNSIAINPELIDCDYYKFLSGDVNAINSYSGEFMVQYSWAEFVIGYLDDKFKHNQ